MLALTAGAIVLSNITTYEAQRAAAEAERQATEADIGVY
jgi:hypothetical protein